VGVGVVLAAAALLYAPALRNGFTNWDDDRQVTANPLIRDLSPEGIRRMFTTFTVSLYQPLTSLTFALEYRFSGLDPRLYHTVNLLLHLANTLLVFAFLRSLVQATGIALVAAALFAVHPLQVEAVAWVSGRSILLSSLFYLGAMITYLAYMRSGRVHHLAGVWVLFVLAILAKTSAATLPLALWAIDLYSRRKDVRRVLAEKVPFLAVSGVFGCIALVARSGVSHVQDFAVRYPPAQRVCIVAYSVLWYPAKLLYPAGLAAFHPFPASADGWLPWTFYAAPIVLVGLGLVVWFGRSSRVLVFGSLFLLACLVLVVQVVPISELMVCDRYAYLPCMGLFLLAGALAWRIGSRGKAWMGGALACTGAALLVLGVLTSRRIEVWRDSLTLWNDVISRRQDIWVAYLNRGLAQSHAGHHRAAIADLDQALRLNPGSAQALNNRAGSHAYLGDYVQALRDFDEAIRLNPDRDFLINRGITKQKRGDLDGALQDFDIVLGQDPGNLRALCEKADTHRLSGHWSKAIEGYEALLAIQPTHAHAAHWLGAVRLDVGQFEEAAAALERAISLGTSDVAGASFLLGRAYQGLGRIDRAGEALRRSHAMGDARAQAELRRMEAGSARTPDPGPPGT